MQLLRYAFQDWLANTGNTKGRLVLLMYRFAQYFYLKPQPLRLLGIPLFVLHKLIVQWLLCIYLPLGSKIGAGLKLYHGYALVVHEKAIIGANCTLRHSTTLGNRRIEEKIVIGFIRIGNNVDIGCNTVILGPLSVGDNVTIGAASLLLKDVQSDTTVAGNPAIVLRKKISFE
jgi:putative colanic acid biosynthesis acetyltransferase WcaB